MSTSKHKTNKYQNDLLDQFENTFETVGEKAKRPATAVKQVLTELVDEVGSEASDLLNEALSQINIFGDLKPNEEFDLSHAKVKNGQKHEEKSENKQKIEVGIDYVGEILH